MVCCVAVSWVKPLAGCFKLSTDASLLHRQGFGCGLLRDHEGKLVFVFCKEFGNAHVLLAEALALCYELQICEELLMETFEVEVDLEVLVHLVNSISLA